MTLIASSGLLVCAPALAQPAAGLTLHWSAPAGCPQQSDLRDRIHKLTGSTTSTTALQAEGTITRTDSAHFHLRLITRSGKLAGERNLVATSCENLSGAAAVSLALLLRSEEPLREGDLGAQPIAGTTPGTGQQSTPTPAGGDATKGSEKTRVNDSAPTSASASATTTSTEDDDVPERPSNGSERRWQILGQLPLVGLGFGPLPKPSWGVAFATGIAFEDWRFLLGGVVWRRQNLATDEFPGYGADVDRLTGTLKACRAWRRSAWEVAPCLVLSIEHISARGTGAGISSRSDQAAWLGVGAGAQGRLHLASWFSVLLGVDAQLETARPVIAIDGVGNLGQLGAAALTVTLGPEWIF